MVLYSPCPETLLEWAVDAGEAISMSLQMQLSKGHYSLSCFLHRVADITEATKILKISITFSISIQVTYDK